MTLFINDFCNHSCIFFSFKTRILILKKGEKIKQFKVHTISNRDIVLSQS